jgi:transglutaminase-like putative cysteine protease
MNMLFEATIGDAFWVRPRVQSFRRAIALAVRPDEAWPIARNLTALWKRTAYSFAHVLAWWFRSERASGRLEYIPDPEGPLDFWCSPETTLERGGGDCDDLAVLGASIILSAGWPGRVVVGTHEGQGHAWVEGRDERGWFLLEATNGDLLRNWRPRAYVPNPYIR